MIQSYRNRFTENIARGIRESRFPPDLVHRAHRKLSLLNAAESLNDLRSPPGNRLHALDGNRQDQYAIRINDQWRICFYWTDAGPSNVEITDYH